MSDNEKDVTEQVWPHYVSTYCMHEQHDDCRLTCKICHAPCLCYCHNVTPSGGDHV